MARAGSITVPVNIDPLMKVETLHLSDGDALVLHVPGALTDDIVARIQHKAGAITRATGKRVALIILPEGHSIDQLTAEQVRDLYHRVTATAEGDSVPEYRAE